MLNTDRRGFTLVEVMVAIAVLISGLVGALVLISYSFFVFRDADNAFVASHLAEEAIEVVVGIRNTNWAQGGDELWDDGILPETTTGTVNYNESEQIGQQDPCMQYDGTYYIHPSSPASCDTPFRRHVEITAGSEVLNGETADYIDVLAVVEWTQGGRTPRVEVSHRLYNWR